MAVVARWKYLKDFKFGGAAGLPLQGQPALYGLQLPAAVCAGLLRLPHHPQGKQHVTIMEIYRETGSI